jgi:capsular polysaccharide biosynthesis protein
MTMETSSFNLEQTVSAIQKRWKNILLFTVACIIIATITVFVGAALFPFCIHRGVGQRGAGR